MLEADYGADAIWCRECKCNLDIEDIPLSQKLKEDLQDWVMNYSKSVLDESEFLYEVAQQHNINGLKLLERVQKELCVKYKISYKSS